MISLDQLKSKIKTELIRELMLKILRLAKESGLFLDPVRDVAQISVDSVLGYTYFFLPPDKVKIDHGTNTVKVKIPIRLGGGTLKNYYRGIIELYIRTEKNDFKVWIKGYLTVPGRSIELNSEEINTEVIGNGIEAIAQSIMRKINDAKQHLN